MVLIVNFWWSFLETVENNTFVYGDDRVIYNSAKKK